MVLDAAASTSGGMLSLSVDVDERGASASSSWSRALVLAGGAAAVQQGHVRSLGSAATISAAVQASESGAGAPSR